MPDGFFLGGRGVDRFKGEGNFDEFLAVCHCRRGAAGPGCLLFARGIAPAGGSVGFFIRSRDSFTSSQGRRDACTTERHCCKANPRAILQRPAATGLFST